MNFLATKCCTIYPGETNAVGFLKVYHCDNRFPRSVALLRDQSTVVPAADNNTISNTVYATTLTSKTGISYSDAVRIFLFNLK